jgi:glycosyltransferase involved in cell wall biosynthesis
VNAVHQFVPSFYAHDAVGAHARQLRQLLRELGLRSEIYTLDGDAGTDEVLPVTRFSPRARSADTALVYQLATGSALAPWFGARPEVKLVNYHNVTPARFFDAWSLDAAAAVATGRRQLRALAATAAVGLAVSAFNQAELVEAGYRATAVAPVLVDLGAVPPDPDAAARLASAKVGLEVLFVGRIAPNKAQHDLVKALAVYRRIYDPAARLQLVGGVAVPRYQTALAGFVEDLGLGEAVTLTGPVSPGVLAAHYRNADVFVCLSEHEGFCVPLLEAMHHGLPVIAYGAAAVPETLGGAGLVLADKSPATVAAAIHAVRADADLRAELVAAGSARLEEFRPDRTRARYVELFEGLLS